MRCSHKGDTMKELIILSVVLTFVVAAIYISFV